MQRWMVAGVWLSMVYGMASASPPTAGARAAHEAACEARWQDLSDAWLDRMLEDLSLRSDADSLAALALLKAGEAEVFEIRANRDDLSEAQREAAVARAANQDPRASFLALWPRRDALAWSQLYPLFERHRPHLTEADRIDWEAYLIQRAGTALNGFALRLRLLEEAEASPEAIDALLGEAAREATPDLEFHYDLVRRTLPSLLRTPVPERLRHPETTCLPSHDADASERVNFSAETLATLWVKSNGWISVRWLGFPSGACEGLTGADDSPRAEACRTLARKQALQGTTVTGRAAAAATWQRLARDPAEQAAALAARRQVRWWLEEGLSVLGGSDGVQGDWIERMEANTRIMLIPGSSELQATRDALREAGLEDAPPDAWLPLNPASVLP